MRLSISNIAWDVEEDAEVARLLREHEIDAIDIAPSKYFPTPEQADPNEIGRVRSWWADRGIEIVGMQALLFATKGLNMFAPQLVQDAMLARLDAVAGIAARLGAPRLVFGSPANRDRTGLRDEDVVLAAVGFFRRVGEVARTHDVLFCLEPNPVRYNCNFMTTIAETAAIVRAVSHPSIKMQLDIGAIAINGEDVADALARHGDICGHIHASEPDLAPLGDGSSNHAAAGAAVAERLSDHIVTIEMRATDRERHLASIERSLRTAIQYYGAGRALNNSAVAG